MKNHFIFTYVGNKRNEVEKLYELTKDNIINKKYIVEPFAGTSAFSYYLSTLYPGKFTYYINDNDENLIKIYKILKSEEKTKIFLEKINEMIIGINKEEYNKILRNKENGAYGLFIKNKIYKFRPGLFPYDYEHKDITLDKCGIINFLRTEKIIINNGDWTECMNKFINKSNAFIFIDPPYAFKCNDYYNKLYSSKNIYKYLYELEGNKCSIIMTVNKHWIVDIIYTDRQIENYVKKYNGFHKYSEMINVIYF